jgi:osmotically-inducible protein OsmY
MFKSARIALLAAAAALCTGGCAGMFGRCDSSASDCAEDARIKAEVQKQLDESPSLKFYSIHVETHNQAVYLEGLVDTRVDRNNAMDVARAVPGVKMVYNELGLRGNGW